MHGFRKDENKSKNVRTERQQTETKQGSVRRAIEIVNECKSRIMKCVQNLQCLET